MFEVSVQRPDTGTLVCTLVSFRHRSMGFIKSLPHFSAKHTDISSAYHPFKEFHYEIAEIFVKYGKVLASIHIPNIPCSFFILLQLWTYKTKFPSSLRVSSPSNYPLKSKQPIMLPRLWVDSYPYLCAIIT